MVECYASVSEFLHKHEYTGPSDFEVSLYALEFNRKYNSLSQPINYKSVTISHDLFSVRALFIYMHQNTCCVEPVTIMFLGQLSSKLVCGAEAKNNAHYNRCLRS